MNPFQIGLTFYTLQLKVWNGYVEYVVEVSLIIQDATGRFFDEVRPR